MWSFRRDQYSKASHAGTSSARSRFGEALLDVALIALPLLALVFCRQVARFIFDDLQGLLGQNLFANVMFFGSFALLVLVGTMGYVAIIAGRRILRWIRSRAGGAGFLKAANLVLLLRAFADDEESVLPKGVLARLQRRRSRLEEAVGIQLERLGPYVAIGMPSERLPQLGARRVYFSDEEWQSAVLRWIGHDRRHDAMGALGAPCHMRPPSTREIRAPLAAERPRCGQRQVDHRS